MNDENFPATRGEFLDCFFGVYSPVKMLSEKEGKKVILCEHRTLKKRLVLRSYAEEVPVYSFLRGILSENLPEVYDVYRFSDGMIVIEEYVRGTSVAETLEMGLFDYKRAKNILCGICNALAVLHENGYVHRDVKPENVMLSEDGKVKLIDFDATRKTKDGARTDTRYLGTVGFASPEQYGVGQSDARSDIYALGVMLNIMLTGHHPSEKPASGKAGKIVAHCTMISPEKRYQSVEKLIKAM